MFRSLVLAGLIAYARSQATEEAGDDVTVSSVYTREVIVPVYVTDVMTSTLSTVVYVTNSLPVSTETSLITQSPSTVTVNPDGVTSTSTVVSTSVVTVGTGSVVTSGTVTTTVIVQPSAFSTKFVTASGTMTVTSTTTSGFATGSTCVPTTTVVSYVTSPVPSPTAVAGLVTYQKSNCNAVVCPNNRKVVTVNGIAKTCNLIYQGANLISSTCLIDYCCEAATSVSNKPVYRHINCKASGLKCPSGSSLLYDDDDQSVPCLQSYVNNVLTQSTCDETVCCSKDRNTVTVTTTNGVAATTSATSSSSTISCKSAVKCSVYAKDSTTNYIKRCKQEDCNVTLCCSRIS